jgi:hypothetical protein
LRVAHAQRKRRMCTVTTKNLLSHSPETWLQTFGQTVT